MRENLEEKRNEEGLFKKIKSDYLKQLVISHLDLKVSAKLFKNTKSCLKYIADNQNLTTNESFAIAKNKLYNEFLCIILVQKDINFIYEICKKIHNKDTDQLFQKYELTGQNKRKLWLISFIYNMPKILCEILSITRSDFDKLNLKDLNDLHGNHILDSTQTIIETILEKKLGDGRISYLEKILLNPNEKVKMQELSLQSLPTSMDDTEKKIRTVTYQEIQYKLICELSNRCYGLQLNYPQWTNKFDFSGIKSWAGYYSSTNEIHPKIDGMKYAYQEKYYMTVEQNIGSFDWIFMDLDNAEECYEEYWKAKANFYWQSDEFKKNLFMSYQRALHGIFKGNEEERVQFSESKRRAFDYWHNIDAHSKKKLLKHCSLWFMVFIHIVWLLAIILFIISCPIGSIALYIIAVKYSIVWLEIIEMLSGIFFVWAFVPFYLGAFVVRHIPYVYKHYTIFKRKYDNYVNQMYLIPNIEKNTVFDSCKKFKTNIVNLKNILDLAKETLLDEKKMKFIETNEVPNMTNTGTIQIKDEQK